MNLKSVLIVLFASLALVATMAALPPVQAGDSWALLYGDPGRSGNHTTTIKLSYTDANGVKQEKTISAAVSLTAEDSANQKKTKIQNKMNEALSDPANTVGGQPLASTSGGGNIMTVTPSAGAKIESTKTEDKETGEKDEIVKPGNKKGLGQVSPEGELLGQTSDRGPSVFFVQTNLGTASVTLTGSMTKLELLKALKVSLVAQDPNVVAWVDSDLQVLFVKLDDYDDERISTLGAGSTDQGLVAACKLLVTD